MRSPAQRSRALFLVVGTCAVLGLLVAHGLGAPGPTAVGSGSSIAGRTPASVGQARMGGRDMVATAPLTQLDVLRHAVDRGLLRRAQPWMLEGILVGLVSVGCAAILLVAIREGRRRISQRSGLPARAPPLLAFG